jgi:hypothetical protein
MQVSIPQDKLAEVANMLEAWAGKRAATLHELRVLLGKLLFVAQCSKPARMFLGRMLATLRDCPPPKDHTHSPLVSSKTSPGSGSTCQPPTGFSSFMNSSSHRWRFGWIAHPRQGELCASVSVIMQSTPPPSPQLAQTSAIWSYSTLWQPSGSGLPRYATRMSHCTATAWWPSQFCGEL